MELRRKVGTETHITFPLIDVANRPFYKTSAGLAAGDVVLWSHTSGSWASANVGTLPEEIAAGTGIYDLVLTAGEMANSNAAYPLIIKVHDQTASAVFDDQTILINTDVVQAAIDDGTIASNVSTIKTATDKMNFTGTDIKATLDGETVLLTLSSVLSEVQTAGSVGEALLAALANAKNRITIDGTVMRLFKADGVNALYTWNLDSATSPKDRDPA